MDGTPQVVRFDATTLWHLDAAEWAPSTASLAIEAGNAARSCTSALLRKQRFGPISAAASKENKNPRRGGTGEVGIGGSAALVGRRNSEDNESPAFVIDVAQKEGWKTWEAAMACRPLGDVRFAPDCVAKLSLRRWPNRDSVELRR
jgi:hypothetical protein